MRKEHHSETGQERRVGRPRVLDSAQASLSLVLNLVRSNAATTRLEVEQRSELGRAVVADRLATLTDLGLIEEAGFGQSAGGRAPRRVQFRAGAGGLLTAVISQTSLAIGFADLAGTPLAEHHEAIEIGAPAGELAERLVALFVWMQEEHPKLDIWGIGLALAGPISILGAASFSTSVLRGVNGWDGFPLVERLVRQFRAPVWVRSDVQVLTMGELRAGAGLGMRDLIFVKLGRTIEAGVVSNGVLHQGAQGAAGLLGHTSVDGESLEAVAGSDAVARSALTLAHEGRSQYLSELLSRGAETGATEVGHAALLGDPACAELLARTGKYIGQSLATVVNIINPEAIILGGTLAQTGDVLLAGVREAVYRLSHPMVTRDLKIVRSEMGDSAGLLGAAQVAAEALFEPHFLNGWITSADPRNHPDFAKFLGEVAVTAKGSDESAGMSKPPRRIGKRV